jgi:hypothetical protein
MCGPTRRCPDCGVACEPARARNSDSLERGLGGDQSDAPAIVVLAPHNAWKRQAIEGMAGMFSGKAEAAAAEREGELEKLHAKIGQLVVERDFLAKASGR